MTRIDYQYPESRMPKTTNEAMKSHLSLSYAPKRSRVAEWVNRVRTKLYGAAMSAAAWSKRDPVNPEQVTTATSAIAIVGAVGAAVVDVWVEPLGYAYRTDGNFLIRRTCFHCGESFDVHACSQANSFPLCPACDSVRLMEKQQREC